MAYIGSTPTSQNFISGTDYFSGTGSQTAFTLTRTVNSVNDIEVVINNVVQQPSTAYTLSGTTITFTSAPSSGTNNIYVRYLSTTLQSITVPANSITRTQLDSNLQAVCTGRNRLINGGMVVDQRNNGASITPTSGQYCVDRWFNIVSQASKYTIQQSTTAPAGFINSLKVTSSSAYSVGSTDYFAFAQAIEGLNCTDLGWGTSNAKTVTLSFWTYSSLTGTFGGAVHNSNSSRTYPFSYTISAVNTWEQKSITIVGDTSGTWLTNNSIGMQIYFGLGVGSTYSGTAGSWAGTNYISCTGATSVVGTNGATFYITGVQLEVGSSATSFDYRQYGQELALCQRYCFAYNGMVGVARDTGNLYQPMFRMATTMRTTPTLASGSTMTVSGGSSGTWATYTDSGAVASGNNLYLYNVTGNWTSGSNAAINGVFTAEL